MEHTEIPFGYFRSLGYGKFVALYFIGKMKMIPRDHVRVYFCFPKSKYDPFISVGKFYLWYTQDTHILIDFLLSSFSGLFVGSVLAIGLCSLVYGIFDTCDFTLESATSLTYMQTGRRTHLLLFLVSNFLVSLSQQSTCINQLETIYEFYFRWSLEVCWRLAALVLPCISMVPEIIILTSWYMTLKLDSFLLEFITNG